MLGVHSTSQSGSRAACSSLDESSPAMSEDSQQVSYFDTSVVIRTGSSAGAAPAQIGDGASGAPSDLAEAGAHRHAAESLAAPGETGACSSQGGSGGGIGEQGGEEGGEQPRQATVAEQSVVSRLQRDLDVALAETRRCLRLSVALSCSPSFPSLALALSLAVLFLFLLHFLALALSIFRAHLSHEHT